VKKENWQKDLTLVQDVLENNATEGSFKKGGLVNKENLN
jgi:hypothetical protein